MQCVEWEEKGNFETISELIMVCYSKHSYFIITSLKLQNCLNAFCQMSNANYTEYLIFFVEGGKGITSSPFLSRSFPKLFFPSFSPTFLQLAFSCEM